MKRDPLHFIFAGLIVYLLVLFVMVVMEAGESQATLIHKASWQAPEIPSCDKELWLRIKDGCDDA